MTKVFLDANLLIYLNVGSEDPILELWAKLLIHHELYADVLVLDEVLWISKKKYHVDYAETIDFIDNHVLPYTTLLPLGDTEYKLATKYLAKATLRPSDALHAAAMETNGLNVIATEDRDFDKIPWITRLWI